MTEDPNLAAPKPQQQADQPPQDHIDALDLEKIEAKKIIVAFGGIRPMANKIAVAVSTVQGWKNRNQIPKRHFAEILQAIHKHGIDVNVLDDTVPSPDPPQIAPENAPDNAPNNAPDNASPTNRKGAAPAPNKWEGDHSTNAASDPVKTPQAQPLAPPKTPPKTTPRFSGLALIALLIALLTGSALVLQPYWQDNLDQWLNPKIQRLAPNLSALRSQSTPLSAQALQEKMRPILTQTDAFAARLEKVEKDLQSAVVQIETHSINQMKLMAQATKSAQQTNPPNLVKVPDLSANIAQIQTAATKLRNQIGTITNQISALDTRLDAAITALPAQIQATTQPQFGPLQRNLQNLTTRLVVAEKQIDTIQNSTALPEDVVAITAIVLAIGQLETAIFSAQPYQDALAIVQGLTATRPKFAPALKTLEKYSEFGLVTRTEITRQFANLARDATNFEPPVSDESWQAKTWDNLRRILQLRRLGDGPNHAPLSRAEAALQQDNLPQAIAAIEGLVISDPVARWRTLAEKRLSAEDALRQLRRLSLAEMSAQFAKIQAPKPRTAMEISQDQDMQSHAQPQSQFRGQKSSAQTGDTSE